MREREWPFPAYPNGWFVVAWADEIGPGETLPLEYFGRDFVLYRDEEGAPHILDALKHRSKRYRAVKRTGYCWRNSF